MFDTGGPSFPDESGANFSAVLGELGRSDLAEQMKRVVIPVQCLAGTEQSFSFLAYPWPTLTRDERYAAEVAQHEPVTMKVNGGSVRIELDCFGQINWFYVDGLPVLFTSIAEVLKQRATLMDKPNPTFQRTAARPLN